MKLILISGKAEAGKTATADILKGMLQADGAKVLKISFAAYLKFICKQYFGWNGMKDLEGRSILQYVGTDIVRKKNLDFWVKTVFDFVITFQDEFDYFIADDTRFPNEIEYFTEQGFYPLALRVIRLGYKNSLTEEQCLHPSETALDSFDFDAIIAAENGLDNLVSSIENNLFNNGLWYSFWNEKR